MPKNRIKFLNTYIDNVTMSEAVEYIDTMIQHKKKGYVVTPNVDFIVRMEKDVQFQKIVENADLIVTDGKPLIWISKKIKTPIKEKISGSDLSPNIFRLAAKKGYTVFLLGGKEGVAEKAKMNMELKYPGINIVGVYSPPFGFEKNLKEVNRINEMINNLSPDILLVCLGSPKQEMFIAKNINKYEACVSLAVGATIDFEAGTIKRAPKWISNIGMEWFYRFLKEPKRLFKRYFVDDMKIFYLYRKYKD
ncbi:N-acetylglucosaminyldiphosphoundecaprenol N-acetyl-beta-D-mannosaminyltransferase [Faecalicoccus acidiformans]|uniref:N-acetylglucosaminyldiphosphoundecaprenol N-acetyl-beta-D-mannosaminyltransferase n=1 Tax=Faecalicoccus acidiformans TaxID=915173 RepID=A0A7W8FXJ7_9FIRM|nr:WecB/TagA/CpsF family glycosyltransferase [Faecalicoccus acidiformans]MBB5185709.1 N-acetylglucosaminyldiphosphoundecaprenol N-acetyl-beta-D-mannosaminyltransferase [Faecalicoccus acidiformans]